MQTAKGGETKNITNKKKVVNQVHNERTAVKKAVLTKTIPPDCSASTLRHFQF